MLCYQSNSKTKMKTGLMGLMPACCSSSKRSMLRDVGKERDAAMEAKSKRSSVSGSVSSKKSSRHSSVSSSGSRSSKSGKALKEKLRMAELLTEVRFLEERQTAEFKAQKLNVEEQYAKSGARVKVLEDLEGDSVNPAISHNSKIDTAYNPVNNRNTESGMMLTRKGIMPKKFEVHHQMWKLIKLHLCLSMI